HQYYDALFFQTRLTGWIYGDMGDYKRQLDYARKMGALALSGLYKSSADDYAAIANVSISMAYLNLNMLDSALYYRYLVYRFALRNKDKQWQALATNGLGNIYSKIGNNDSAFLYYRMADYYSAQANRRDINSNAKLGLANLFYHKGQLDSAFYYTRQSLEILQNTNAPGNVLDAYSLVSKLYQSRYQYDSAYKYLERFAALNDSVNNQQKIAQAQNFAFNETLKQQQIEQAKKEAKQQYKNELKIYILAAIILIFLIIALLLFRNNRNRRKANILLGKQKEEIATALSELKSTQSQLIQSEKMASLGELTAGIAHEIQNPLNFVNNFSDINTELIGEADQEIDKGNLSGVKDILNDIKANEEKINHHGKRADAIVKGMLQHSRTSTGQKELTDINALRDEYLRLAYHGMRAKDKSFNCTLETQLDPSIPKIKVVPQDMGRVLLNLINNALFTVGDKSKQHLSGYEPTVTIRTENSGDSIEITVKDNGNGIPVKIKDKIFQPFFTTKPTGQGTGLGLSLSYDIVKAHGGEIKVNSKEGEGTELNISLPIVWK
ncbi:MAG: hypothetical protein H3C64_09950, partial [Candidatus Kuenenia stuttgartiensis]|nr:hypothetical protein [Candidatus Kuenenia stuttgartiensis]